MNDKKILMSGFYKLSPIKPLDGEMPLFVYLKEPNEDVLSYVALSANSKFYNGATISRADKTDICFLNYLTKDFERVTKEIQKLSELKANIEKEIKQIL